VVAGHLCLDIIPDLARVGADQLARMFLPGRLTTIGEATFSTGGAVSNTGVALHVLGLRTRLVGKLGDDLFGSAVRRFIGAYGPGLPEGFVVDPGAPTAYTLIISPQGVDRCFLGFLGANDTFGGDDVDNSLLHETRLFHLGYPPLLKRMFARGGAELAHLFRRAKAAGATTSLDTALPDPYAPSGRADWRAIIAATLPHVDLFLPSAEEILYMLRRERYDALCRAAGGPDVLPLITLDLLSELGGELLALGARVICLKLGERGLYLRSAGRSAMASLGRARPPDLAAWADLELWAPCFQVQVVGTTGAGDAAIAGFLSGLLRGLSPGATLTAAAAVGACCVEADDALSGIRPWEKTLRRIAGGWERHPPDFDLTGWQLDEASQVWVREGMGRAFSGIDHIDGIEFDKSS